MLGFSALGQTAIGETPTLEASEPPVAPQRPQLRAALEEQSRRNRYRTRYRTFGRSE